MTEPKKPMSRKAISLALAVALAAPAEGMRQIAYRDPVGIPTICMGSTKGVRMGDTATVEQCKLLLNKEMLEVIDVVDRCVPNLDPHVLAAFADTAYNVGEKVACDPKHSTAARLLKAGDIVGACNRLTDWDKARIAGVLVALPGLTKRRAIAKETCLQGVTPHATEPIPVIAADVPAVLTLRVPWWRRFLGLAG